MKALIIGWDAATWAYIDPLLAQGRLPNLAALLQQAARGVLYSTLPPYTHVAWPSLVTGLSPAKTGLFDLARVQPGSYTLVPVSGLGFRGIPLWQWVGRFGGRVGVLNVPMTYPPQPVQGYLVSGFDTPRQARVVAYPHDILAQWARQGYPYTVLSEEIRLMGQQNPHHPRGDLDAFTAEWEHLTREQGRLVAWLWKAWPVDVMFVVFSGTDSINHRTWSFAHIARVYRAADEALGMILDVVEPGTLICLVSDHGSTPARRYISLHHILARHGWIRFRPEIAVAHVRRLPAPWGAFGARVWAGLPVVVRKGFSRWLLRWAPRLNVDYTNIDWPHTRVFVRSGLGPMYLHTVKRYPQGQITEDSYDEWCEQVREACLTLKDPEGRPLFRRVWQCHELYPGAREADDPPDLVLEPARWSDYLIPGYPADPLVRPIPQEKEYGTHTPEGVVVLAGPYVQAGATIQDARLTDVVPTVLACLGLPVPQDVQGRVWQEAFERPLTVTYEAAEASMRDTEEGELSASERRELWQRLADLGYL